LEGGKGVLWRRAYEWGGGGEGVTWGRRLRGRERGDSRAGGGEKGGEGGLGAEEMGE